MTNVLQPTSEFTIDVSGAATRDNAPAALIFISSTLVDLTRGTEDLDPLEFDSGTVSLIYTAQQVRTLAHALLHAADTIDPCPHPAR